MVLIVGRCCFQLCVVGLNCLLLFLPIVGVTVVCVNCCLLVLSIVLLLCFRWFVIILRAWWQNNRKTRFPIFSLCIFTQREFDNSSQQQQTPPTTTTKQNKPNKQTATTTKQATPTPTPATMVDTNDLVHSWCFQLLLFHVISHGFQLLLFPIVSTTNDNQQQLQQQ